MAKGKKTGGRRKGSGNRFPMHTVKAALVEAFDQLGGVPALVACARDHPIEFYKLWSRMLPTEIKADITGGLQLELVEEIVDNQDPEDDQAAP